MPLQVVYAAVMAFIQGPSELFSMKHFKEFQRISKTNNLSKLTECQSDKSSGEGYMFSLNLKLDIIYCLSLKKDGGFSSYSFSMSYENPGQNMTSAAIDDRKRC